MKINNFFELLIHQNNNNDSKIGVAEVKHQFVIKGRKYRCTKKLKMYGFFVYLIPDYPLLASVGIDVFEEEFIIVNKHFMDIPKEQKIFALSHEEGHIANKDFNKYKSRCISQEILADIYAANKMVNEFGYYVDDIPDIFYSTMLQCNNRSDKFLSELQTRFEAIVSACS